MRLVKGSVKRTIMFWSGWSLMAGGMVVITPAGVWIWQHGDLGGGAVAAVIAAFGAIAGGAGIAYRKPGAEGAE